MIWIHVWKDLVSGLLLTKDLNLSFAVEHGGVSCITSSRWEALLKRTVMFSSEKSNVFKSSKHLGGSINGATPSHHPNLSGIFPFTKTIHIIMGYPP